MNYQRYSRQILFAPIGENGQQKLLASRVAIVGMGALGTVLANHMVRAGVGYVRIIDRDFVEFSNLQRQMLYDEEDAKHSSPKAVAAAQHLRAINSEVTVEPHIADLNPLNAEQLLADVHLILDGTDNFAVRFLINDVSVKHGIPWIYGGAVSSRGVVMPVIPGKTPCLRCVFASPPNFGTAETCDTVGVIGPIIHLVASYQAAEALKLLVGDERQINRNMMHFDLWQNHHAGVDISGARKTDCPTCGLRQFSYLELEAQEETVQTMCGRDSVQILPIRSCSFSLEDWEKRWKPLGRVDRNPFLLKLEIDEKTRLVLFPDGRVIVQGTGDPIAAKNLYSKFVGM